MFAIDNDKSILFYHLSKHSWASGYRCYPKNYNSSFWRSKRGFLITIQITVRIQEKYHFKW